MQIGGNVALAGGVLTGDGLGGVSIGGTEGLAGIISAGGALGPVTVPNGPVTGSIQARSVTGNSVVGGDFTGMLLKVKTSNPRREHSAPASS